MSTVHPRTPEQIRETFRTHRKRGLTLEENGALPAFKRICAFWHNRLGACYTLDYERFLQLRRRHLEEGFGEDDIKAAIECYHQTCSTDAWRLEHREARLTLGRFLESERFEHWIDQGQQLLARRADAHKRSDQAREIDDRRQSESLNRYWKTLTEEARKQLVGRAAEELRMREKFTGEASMNNIRVKQKVKQYLQQSLRDQQVRNTEPASAVARRIV